MRGIFLILVFISCFLIRAYPVFSYEMSSTGYRLQESSINVGGEEVQTSTSYRLRESIGEPVVGEATSTSYKIRMGYQSMQEVYISLSAPSEATMSPDIGGVAGGKGNSSATTTVTTDSPSGYSLSLKVNTDPALKCSSGECNPSTDNFSNYIPAGTNPDYNWQVSATSSEFGFTPEGNHIVPKYKDDGSICNTGGTNDNPDKCWYYFSSASEEEIAQSYLANHPSGTQTIIKFRAESGGQYIQAPGQYQASIIITAIAN